jgi:hypothetical protein
VSECDTEDEDLDTEDEDLDTGDEDLESIMLYLPQMTLEIQNLNNDEDLGSIIYEELSPHPEPSSEYNSLSVISSMAEAPFECSGSIFSMCHCGLSGLLTLHI